MPWLPILLIIVAAYVLIISIQGIRDFIIWYREGRAFVAEQKRLRALRRQQRSANLNMPALKERPTDSSKPPVRIAKPSSGDSGIKKL